jgi:hypothetical protein
MTNKTSVPKNEESEEDLGPKVIGKQPGASQ